MVKLSVVIFTKDDIDYATALIAQVVIFSEDIIILDSSSAKEHDKLLNYVKGNKHIRVKYAAALGHPEPYNWYMKSLAKQEWIMRFEAFDRVTEGLIEEIKRITSGEKKYDAIIIDRVHATMDGRPILINPYLYLFKKNKYTPTGWLHSMGPMMEGSKIYKMQKQFQVLHLSEYDKMISGAGYKNLERYLRIERYEHRLTYKRLTEKLPKWKVFYWLVKSLAYMHGKSMEEELTKSDYYLSYIFYWFRLSIKQLFEGRYILNSIRFPITYDSAKIKAYLNPSNPNLHELKIQEAMYRSGGVINYLDLHSETQIKNLNKIAKKEKLYGVNLFVRMLEANSKFEEPDQK